MCSLLPRWPDARFTRFCPARIFGRRSAAAPQHPLRCSRSRQSLPRSPGSACIRFSGGSQRAYLQALFHFASRDYFVQPGEFWLIVSTVTVLQGLALFVVSAAWCQIDAAFFARDLRMLTLGGAGLATMSVVRLAEVLLRDPAALARMRATYDGLRISPQIPDFIAAGSFFSLCWLAALGLAIASARQRLAWVVVSLPLLAALYLTGSRSVIAAALGGVVVLAFISFVRPRATAMRAVIAVAVIAVVVMIGSFRWMVGHDIAGAQAQASLSVRGELLRVGVRVIETRPLFGVGIDRFFLVAGTVKSPLLDASWSSRRNPHNDFLRFAGELGLVGLGLFLWILVSAGARIWQALRAASDPRLAGLVSGLVAFLITSMVSNPLMLREVSYVFWIALGLAVGRSTTVQQPIGASERSLSAAGSPNRASRWRVSAAWIFAGVLIVSVPFRAKHELATIDPTAGELRSLRLGPRRRRHTLSLVRAASDCVRERTCAQGRNPAQRYAAVQGSSTRRDSSRWTTD